MTKNNLSPAWKKILKTQLTVNIKEQGPSAAYLSLSTVRPDNTPANRVVVFRGFAGESYKEETGWESDLLTLTCDKRSSKVKEISENPNVELCWFMGSTKEQFRIRGRMHAFGDGLEPSEGLNSHIGRKHHGMSSIDEEKEEDHETDFSDRLSQASKSFLKRIRSLKHHIKPNASFDWQAERLRQWYGLSDQLRATFTWPASGTPKETVEEDADTFRIETLTIEESDDNGWFFHKDADKQALLEQGYENFVVLFLEVTEVDHSYLEVNERTIYRKEDDVWNAVPVNP
ncbi:pyridoxamine 5'-phosphate oxidase-domain-containing protein [Phycomyces nitens]|nr:pyridoxamine 5'-phosphate oxidase-domain-containing protein [Phycomyces nitens]